MYCQVCHSEKEGYIAKSATLKRSHLLQVRKVGVRQPKKALGTLVSAAEIKTTEEKEEADKNMEEMYNKLAQNDGINVLQCVMNHESFSQTVENIFALSFLVSPSLSHAFPCSHHLIYEMFPLLAGRCPSWRVPILTHRNVPQTLPIYEMPTYQCWQILCASACNIASWLRGIWA
jgi:hypothetical protein